MNRVRPAAVAGSFYPADPTRLRQAVDGYLAQAVVERRRPRPKALIVPHAGYVYSGPVAGSAYAQLERGASSIRRVVLLGPSHFVAFRGLALPAATELETPLGRMRVDEALARSLGRLVQVGISEAAHRQEHCLEVQLPFLQRLLPEAEIVPLVVGQAATGEVADVLEALWGGDDTLILLSTDLSHYLPYEQARETDARTAASILRADAQAIASDDACGAVALRGLLDLARRKGLAVEQLDLRSSGDTAGDRDRVVGYGAFALREARA